MALIKCPECGKEVSDKAPACIHCGYPLNETNINKSSSNISNPPIESFDIIFKGLTLTADYSSKQKICDKLYTLCNYDNLTVQHLFEHSPQTILTGLSKNNAIWVERYFSGCNCVIEKIESISGLNSVANDKVSFLISMELQQQMQNAIHRRPNKIRQLEDTPENRRKLFPEAYNDKFVSISEQIGVPPRTIAKATSILEKLDLIVCNKSYNVQTANDRFRTQDIIFANPYKREGVYLLDDSAEYSKREIKNKEKKMQEFNSGYKVKIRK